MLRIGSRMPWTLYSFVPACDMTPTRLRCIYPPQPKPKPVEPILDNEK
jgi:hypothetical protein